MNIVISGLTTEERAYLFGQFTDQELSLELTRRAFSPPITFLCRYCQFTASQIKLLFDHYEAEHAPNLLTYQIKHKPSGNRGLARAPTPELACMRLAWKPEECTVKEIKENGRS